MLPKLFWAIWLSPLLVVMCPGPCFVQAETVSKKHSATQEKQEEEADADRPSSPATPKPRPWNKVQGDWGEVNLAAALLIDFFLYGQDDQSREQVGDLIDFEVPEIRTLRLGGTGKLNFKRPWTWVAQVVYRGFDRGWDRSQDATWDLFDLSITIPIPKIGDLSVGKMKEPFSLERNMLAIFLPLMERAAGNDALLQSRNSGFKLSNTAFNQRMTWSGGWFPGFMERGDVLSQADQIIGRVTIVPIDGHDGDGLLHLGLSSRYSFRRGSDPVVAHYRGTPESFGVPDFLDTGDLSMERVIHFGLEGGFRKGPFWASSEWITAKPTILRPSTAPRNDPRFHSFHAQAAYTLTGEHRTYDRKKGLFAGFLPRRDLISGGPGLWEVAFRYSHTDLQDSLITGGVLDRWTGAVSWTPKGLIKLEANYGVARLDKNQTIGKTQILQGRLQLVF